MADSQPTSRHTVRPQPCSQERTGWIQTYTGAAAYPLERAGFWPIRIDDIAHALSNICRFGGHCREFYSVAQHSVIVSRVVPPEFAGWGLMHDAAEAYIGDVPRPIRTDEHRAIERGLLDDVWVVFSGALGLQRAYPESIIKHADNRVLAAEKRDLMSAEPQPWLPLPEPIDERIVPLLPRAAKRLFLERYEQLWRSALERDWSIVPPALPPDGDYSKLPVFDPDAAAGEGGGA